MKNLFTFGLLLNENNSIMTPRELQIIANYKGWEFGEIWNGIKATAYIRNCNGLTYEFDYGCGGDGAAYAVLTSYNNSKFDTIRASSSLRRKNEMFERLLVKANAANTKPLMYYIVPSGEKVDFIEGFEPPAGLIIAQTTSLLVAVDIVGSLNSGR